MTKHGRMLKRWRKANGLDQRGAARRLKSSQSSISMIETGARAAGKKMQERIEKVCAS